MDPDADLGSEKDELAGALTPARFGMVLAVLVAVFLLIRARRAR